MNHFFLRARYWLRPGCRRRTVLLSLLVGMLSAIGVLVFIDLKTPLPPWLVVLIPTLSAFFSTIIVYLFAPAAAGNRHNLVSDMLGDLLVNEFYHRTVMPTIRENASAKELKTVLSNEEVLFPLTVIDSLGTPCGILTMGNVRPIYFDDVETNLFLVKDMAGPLVTCTGDESMASALRKFESSGYSRLPVVSASDTTSLLGYLQYQDIMAAYEAELERRRLAT